MVKKNETSSKLLMITLNILLTFIATLMIQGLSGQKKQTEAINNLQVVLSVHSEKIYNIEEKNKDQDGEIHDLDNRVDVLEKTK